MNRQLRRTHPDTALPTITLGPDMPRASCKGQDPRLWDPTVEGETKAERIARYSRAGQLCAACPTRAKCLAERLAHPELHGGVWGGRLFADKGSWPVELPAATRPAAKTGRQCPECGADFTSGGHGQRYCSTTCRDAVNNREKAAKRKSRRRANGTPVAPSRCQQGECGLELTSDQRQRREHYCSDTCRKAVDRDRKRTSTHTSPIRVGRRAA